jgi:hypothetical protein
MKFFLLGGPANGNNNQKPYVSMLKSNGVLCFNDEFPTTLWNYICEKHL